MERCPSDGTVQYWLRSTHFNPARPYELQRVSGNVTFKRELDDNNWVLIRGSSRVKDMPASDLGDCETACMITCNLCPQQEMQFGFNICRYRDNNVSSDGPIVPVMIVATRYFEILSKLFT